MASFGGWIIICTGFSLVSAALLWPAYRLTRRRHPGLRHPAWLFAAATVLCSITLWYLIPLAVWALYGRVPH